MSKQSLYEWLFHFNPHTNKWCAFRRQDYVQHFNNGKNSIRSSNINTLIEIVERTDGDISKLNTENNK